MLWKSLGRNTTYPCSTYLRMLRRRLAHQRGLSTCARPHPPYPFVSVNLISSYVANTPTPLAEPEGNQEPGTGPPHKPPHIDLSNWRNPPSIDNGHGGDTSPLDFSLDGEDYTHIRMDSPPPLDDYLADAKDERCYRMLLEHEFHPSCGFPLLNPTYQPSNGSAVTLPLWSPSTVEIGAVGYLRRPEGGFFTLFNAFDPSPTSNGVLRGMANLHGYGNIAQGNYRRDIRNRSQRTVDVLQSWLSPKSNPFVYPLTILGVAHSLA